MNNLIENSIYPTKNNLPHLPTLYDQRVRFRSLSNCCVTSTNHQSPLTNQFSGFCLINVTGMFNKCTVKQILKFSIGVHEFDFVYHEVFVRENARLCLTGRICRRKHIRKFYIKNIRTYKKKQNAFFLHKRSSNSASYPLLLLQCL